MPDHIRLQRDGRGGGCGAEGSGSKVMTECTPPEQKRSPSCHRERSEGSHCGGKRHEVLRFAQDDK
jgi:hypothetical protein